MFPDFSKVRIFIRPGHTDMRKAINGLAVMVSEDMNGDPLSGGLYLFCNRQRKNMKALYWDRNGFCLWQKKLEKHKFPWPNTDEGARELTREELDLLLKGIDFFHAHTKLKFSKVS
jgi:transposase